MVGERDWWTIGEAADILGTSRQQVRRLCIRGELRCERSSLHPRAHRRIPKADLERYRRELKERT